MPRQDKVLNKQVRELFCAQRQEKSEESWLRELEAISEISPGLSPKAAESGDAVASLQKPAGTRQDHAENREILSGRVLTIFSGACEVERRGRYYECSMPSRFARDQQAAVAVGDEVLFQEHGEGYRLGAVLERRSVLSRPDPHNPRLERVIAANIDIVVQVVSVAEPPLRPALIDRYLIATERGGSAALLCVNKIDLLSEEALGRVLEKLQHYRGAGLAILLCSASTGQGVGRLRAALAGRTSVFVGHSGVGKSSLISALDPDISVMTGAVSRRFARGRHTTTRSRLYRLEDDIQLIDTPGIRELGLWRISAEELPFYFSDFEQQRGHCRFSNCSHTHEPDCAVRAAVNDGQIPQERYATYLRILESLSGKDSS